MRYLTLLFAALCSNAAFADFSGRVVTVQDGDSLTMSVEGKRVRVELDGIDAPELDQPYGKSARRSLAKLCTQRSATVIERAKDLHGRSVGRVSCAGIDANAAQVQQGMAWASAGNQPPGSSLYELEANARLRKLGLWRGSDPVPPWKWRPAAAMGGK